MKLTGTLLQQLLQRKLSQDSDRIKELLTKKADGQDPLEVAKKKVATFDKQVAALLAEGNKLRALTEAFDKKVNAMEKLIKDKVGHSFFWDLKRGLQYAGGYNEPGYKAKSYLDSLIRDALLDLQVRCLPLKGEALAKEIQKFQDSTWAQAAIDKSRGDENV